MSDTNSLLCDGCGHSVDSLHIAKRLQRLEWATRFRPLHIHTLLVGGISPISDGAFFYSPEGEFVGEARAILEIVGIEPAGKPREAVHAEFQRAGFFLTHTLECPADDAERPALSVTAAIAKQAPFVAKRIRRSLKPRRVALISQQLASVLETFSSAQLECPVILDGTMPFAVDSSDSAEAILRAREALAVPAQAR